MNLEDKILEYLNGEMSPTEAALFEEKISGDSALKELVKDYQILSEVIGEFEMEIPSIELTQRFTGFLHTELNATPVKSIHKPWYRYMGIAASMIILIAAGILFGIQYSQNNTLENQSTELALLRNKVQEMLDDQSVPTRINAMYVAQNSISTDPTLINMLIKTMKEDESSHVRLAAVQALSDYTGNDAVKIAILEHLEKENDPFVKVAIIQSLRKMKNSNAVHTFDDLIKNEETPRFIKDEAHKAILELNKI